MGSGSIAGRAASLLRRAGLDRNPMRRPVDRVETVAVVVATVPAPAPLTVAAAVARSVAARPGGVDRHPGTGPVAVTDGTANGGEDHAEYDGR
jgi:hypothetical protein